MCVYPSSCSCIYFCTSFCFLFHVSISFRRVSSTFWHMIQPVTILIFWRGFSLLITQMLAFHNVDLTFSSVAILSMLFFSSFIIQEISSLSSCSRKCTISLGALWHMQSWYLSENIVASSNLSGFRSRKDFPGASSWYSCDDGAMSLAQMPGIQVSLFQSASPGYDYRLQSGAFHELMHRATWNGLLFLFHWPLFLHHKCYVCKGRGHVSFWAQDSNRVQVQWDDPPLRVESSSNLSLHSRFPKQQFIRNTLNDSNQSSIAKVSDAQEHWMNTIYLHFLTACFWSPSFIDDLGTKGPAWWQEDLFMK